MKSSKLLPMLALTLTLSACATTQAPGRSTPPPALPSTATPTASTATRAPSIDEVKAASRALVCSEFHHVLLSKSDTDGTKEQVIANNRVLRELGCPPPK